MTGFPGTGPPIERRSYSVESTFPRQVSLALMRYRAVNPLILLFAAVVVLSVVFAVRSGNGQRIAFTIAVAALFLVVTFVAPIPYMERALRGRGYRPGSTVTIDWYRDRFVVITESSHGTHSFAAIRHVRTAGAVVILYSREAKLLIVLPERLVPREALPALRAK